MGNKSSQAKRAKRLRDRKIGSDAHPRVKKWDRVRDLATAGQPRAVPKPSHWTGVVKKPASPLVAVRDARGRQHKQRLTLPLAKKSSRAKGFA